MAQPQYLIGRLQERKVRKLFSVFDFDHNGMVEKSDFENHVKRLSEARKFKEGSQEYEQFHGMMMAWWEKLRQSADTDQDGRISPQEWITFWSAALAAAADNAPGALQEIKNSASLTFDLIDGDHDGKITPEEFSQWLHAWDIKDGEQIFNNLDTAKKGFLDREYVVRCIKEFFLSNDPEAVGNFVYGPLPQ